MARPEKNNTLNSQKSDFHSTRSSDESKAADDQTQIKTSDNLANDGSQKTSATSPNSRMEGKLIKGRYQIEKLIGHGGMSDVYRATDLLLKAAGVSTPYVALKILQTEYLSQPGAAKILIREAQKTQQLSHPNIIRVYDFGAEKQAHYLVMEWLDGETLEEVIKRSRPNGLNYPSSMKLLNQIVSALKYAHSQGVVHADLKPSNIMLTRDGTIKIFDFGVSRALNLNADIYSAEVKDETNALCGYTPTYASPELLKGNEPEIKDDIFAFSCIAYELLTSQHPFNRKPADLAQQSQIQISKPRNISYRKWRILSQGLQFDALKRLDSFDTFNQRMNAKHWPQITALATICGIAAIAGYGYHLKNNEIIKLSSSIQQLEQNVAAEHQLANLPSSKLLEYISSFPEDKSLLRDGLLRKNKNRILSIYEKRISTILNRKDERYPDYYAVEKELQSAKQLYPDSMMLSTLSADINNSWQATIDMLAHRINTLLEQGDYQEKGDENDIYQLMADLGNVKSDFKLSPSKKAETTFLNQLKTASNQRDFSKLSEIIKAGNLIFTEQAHLLTSAIKLKDAIQHMNEYREQKKHGNSDDFPHLAANLFYEYQFGNFNAQLNKVRTVAQLDKLNKNVNKLTTSLPNDFSPLIQIRLSMATRYLEFSDQFLKAKKERTASSVMKKAKSLFARVEEAKAYTLRTQANHG